MLRQQTQRWLTIWFSSMLFLGGAAGCSSLRTDASAAPAGSGQTASATATPQTNFANRRDDTDIEPTVVSYRDYKDPLIKVNRAVFAFNDVTYRWILIPLSEGYMQIVPDAVHKSVGNFFYNIKTPIYATNHLLQLEFKPMGVNLARFVINTTLGLGGLFDPAQAWFDLEKKETHFEETLMQYDMGYGVYLVLPFFGPSDLRNGTSKLVDFYLNPIPHLLERPNSTFVQGYDHFQAFAPDADRYTILRDKSEDPYIFFRNYYLQGVQRDAHH